MMSWVGLVWDLRTPPKHIRDAHLAPKPLIPQPELAPVVPPVADAA